MSDITVNVSIEDLKRFLSFISNFKRNIEEDCERLLVALKKLSVTMDSNSIFEINQSVNKIANILDINQKELFELYGKIEEYYLFIKKLQEVTVNQIAGNKNISSQSVKRSQISVASATSYELRAEQYNALLKDVAINDIVDPTEKRGKVFGFFASLFGGRSQQNEPQNVAASFTLNDEADSLETTSQILQQPDDVADTVSEEQEFVKAIKGMDFDALSDEDKDLMCNTAQKYIKKKYGDLVSEDRINEIPKHIKIADTEECRKAYEALGDKYSDNIVGFYCPATDEIYVDAPRNGDMTEIMATIEHESLHLASNGGLNGNLENVEGMSIYRLSTNLNEGVTELYAMRDMEEMGFDYNSTSYQQQVEVVKALEDAIGKDTIRTAYFNNQPELIRSEFETAFASESDLQALEAGKTVHNGTYIDFLNAVDQYIDTHPSDHNYDSRRDTVFDWISNLKAKRRIN